MSWFLILIVITVNAPNGGTSNAIEHILFSTEANCRAAESVYNLSKAEAAELWHQRGTVILADCVQRMGPIQ